MNKILLVDDHSDIRRLIRITLGKDFDVLEAEDGLTGLEIARKQQPDLVVLDVMMPGEMDGLQVLDAIKGDETLDQPTGAKPLAQGQGLGIRSHPIAMQCPVGRAVHAPLPFELLQQSFHLVGNDLIDELGFLLAVELMNRYRMNQHQHHAGQREGRSKL